MFPTSYFISTNLSERGNVKSKKKEKKFLFLSLVIDVYNVGLEQSIHLCSFYFGFFFRLAAYISLLNGDTVIAENFS